LRESWSPDEGAGGLSRRSMHLLPNWLALSMWLTVVLLPGQVSAEGPPRAPSAKSPGSPETSKGTARAAAVPSDAEDLPEHMSAAPSPHPAVSSEVTFDFSELAFAPCHISAFDLNKQLPAGLSTRLATDPIADGPGIAEQLVVHVADKKGKLVATGEIAYGGALLSLHAQDERVIGSDGTRHGAPLRTLMQLRHSLSCEYSVPANLNYGVYVAATDGQRTWELMCPEELGKPPSRRPLFVPGLDVQGGPIPCDHLAAAGCTVPVDMQCQPSSLPKFLDDAQMSALCSKTEACRKEGSCLARRYDNGIECVPGSDRDCARRGAESCEIQRACVRVGNRCQFARDGWR